MAAGVISRRSLFLALSSSSSCPSSPSPKPPTRVTIPSLPLCSSRHRSISFPKGSNRRSRDSYVVAAASALAEDLDVIPVQSSDSTDQQDGVIPSAGREQQEEQPLEGPGSQVGAFALESGGGVLGGGGSGSVGFSSALQDEDVEKSVDRAINAAIVLAAGTFVITKLLTVDSDYWHALKKIFGYADRIFVGWTLYEILRYAPQHNWAAYEQSLKTNPVLAKMMISGAVYSLGDWIAQCYEGKPLFEFDRARMFRSGLVGFSLHGSLSHYYYRFCEALFPFQDWWVVPAKVVFDQTAWSAIWNSIYYVALGFLRLESPTNIVSELKATFWPMLTAGWKLWPFAHLITYGVIPVEQRLLWVDCVELVWVTILSTYSNEKSEARNSEVTSELNTKPASHVPEELINSQER